MKNKSVLITGGAGFIGSHLIDLLDKDNIEYKVLDNLSNGSTENIWLTHPRLATPRGPAPSRTPYLAKAWSKPRARSCARGSTGLCLCRVSFRDGREASGPHDSGGDT